MERIDTKTLVSKKAFINHGVHRMPGVKVAVSDTRVIKPARLRPVASEGRDQA